MAQVTEDKLKQLLGKIDPHSTLLRSWPLQGGVSAQITALEIARADGQTHTLIVRRHGALDLLHNPQIAADEFKLLQILQSLGIAAPKPYVLDQSGEIFATPCIVVEYIEGQPEFAPTDLDDCLAQAAAQLSSIHAIDAARPDLSFLPDQRRVAAEHIQQRPARLDHTLNEGRIRDALESAWPFPQHNRSVLLHGDFWPGNLLWQAGRLAAVIDWEDAKVGDPLADLANSRLEILWAFGADAMERFTQQYRSLAQLDVSSLACWDLYAALRPAFKIAEWAADKATEERMRERHKLFVAQALQQLA
jgi:aminoglycoside phosphotransferase (APT) family kinase protein